MKKLSLLFLFFIAILMTSCTQKESVQLSKALELQRQRQVETPYKLYPTSNMWTFIKLDTRNGKMWQVQFSIKGNDYRFEVPLNPTPVISDSDAVGRFELYPTQNMYNFILLDGLEGNTWQVQWSVKPENRAIIPIQ